MPYDLNKISHDARADILRARLAPTMAEAARIYFAALDKHNLPRDPVPAREFKAAA